MSNIDDINRKIRADNERAKNLTDMCTEGDFRANRPTRQYTTEDFQKAQFARADDGLLAIRAFPGESKPWLFVTKKGIVAGRPDGSMAREGWAPVTDQVSGRTITRTEYRDTLDHAVKISGHGDDWERGFCTGLTVGGTRVVSDPEPEPDPEDVRKLAQALAAAAFDKTWESFDDLARQALKRGVIAPGGDDADKATMSEHWRERAELVTGDRYNKHLAEDEDGELAVPFRGRPGVWTGRFNPRNPAHWPSWLRSRLTGKLVMIERDGR